MLAFAAESCQILAIRHAPHPARKDSVEAKRVPVLEEVAKPACRVNEEHVEIAARGLCMLCR